MATKSASEEVENSNGYLSIALMSDSPHLQTHQWLDVEASVIEQELRHTGRATRRPQQKRQMTRKASTNSAMQPMRTGTASGTGVSLLKKEPGMPWRTAARSVQRW